MAMIDNYIADLENVEDLYQVNWVLPYGSAYATAHSQFKATLQSQADWDKMKAELFLTAVTMGFGAGLGAMFGKSALSAVMADQALTLVCNRNMNRTFNAMATISSSVPGTFIVQQVWDTVAGKVSEAAKTQVQGLFAQAPATAAMREPQVMQNDMQAYVLRCKTAAHAVAADVRDNAKLSVTEKDQIATRMRAAQFFSDAPKRDVIGNRQGAADVMELSFYMVMVMDSDYMEESTIWQRGAHEGQRTRNLGGVSAATSSPTYGAAPPMKSSYGLGYSNTTSVYVAYNSPGSRILDRINVLYKAKFGGEFFPNGFFDRNTYGRSEVTRAERAIDRLNQLVLARAV